VPAHDRGQQPAPNSCGCSPREPAKRGQNTKPSPMPCAFSDALRVRSPGRGVPKSEGSPPARRSIPASMVLPWAALAVPGRPESPCPQWRAARKQAAPRPRVDTGASTWAAHPSGLPEGEGALRKSRGILGAGPTVYKSPARNRGRESPRRVTLSLLASFP
jgi:hypothetical protein